MRNSRPIRSLVLRLCGFIAFLAIAAGCGLDPITKVDPPVSPHIYPSRSAPESALVYLTIAWARLDSLAADTIYTENYTGNSIDLRDTQPVALAFTKSDEVRVFASLAKNQDVVVGSALMDLFKVEWIRVNDANYPAPDVTISVPHVKIGVTVNGDHQYLAESNRSIVQFTFEPHANAPGDTTWQIIHWEEKFQP